MAAPRVHALRSRAFHRLRRLLCPVPSQKCSFTLALLRRGEANERPLGQIRPTHLELERRIAEKAPSLLRKILQGPRHVSLAQTPPAFPPDALNGCRPW